MNPATINPEVYQSGKPLDANRYATKKTIAQGMLDIALLTANASQLKYILQVGPRHEFYNLMLGLICTSIVLQVASAAFSGLAAMLASGADKDTSGSWTTWSTLFDHMALGLTMFRVVADVTKMCFGLDPALPVLSGVVCVMLGSSYNINKNHHHGGANMWNNVAMALNLVTTAVNVVISSFDMRGSDPADFATTPFPARFTPTTCFNCSTN